MNFDTMILQGKLPKKEKLLSEVSKLLWLSMNGEEAKSMVFPHVV